MASLRNTMLGGAVAGLALVPLTAGVSFAQGVLTSQTPLLSAVQPSGVAPTHEQMHQMMDAMHGEEASERMHQSMGEDAEELMDQCVAMMSSMPGMMGETGGMPSMMGGRPTSAMERRSPT